MKKMLQIVLFLLVVSVGIFLIDNYLFGLEGESCRCSHFMILHEECEAACMAYGGCDEAWLHAPGYCHAWRICCTKVYNWCMDDIHFVIGYHCIDNCWECPR